MRSILVALCTICVLFASIPVLLGMFVGWALTKIARAIEAFIASDRRFVTWQQATRFDASMGFRLVPDLDTYMQSYPGTDPYRVKTCPDGWPGTLRLQDADVVVIGDSFAAGCGVDSDSAYFAPQPDGPRIKALACSGYNMVQGLQALRLVRPQDLKGRLVVWLVCIGNDLADNWHPAVGFRRIPFVRENAGQATGWEIVTEHLRLDAAKEQPWTASLGRTRNAKATACAIVDYYRECYASARGYQIAEYLVREAARFVSAAGGELIVFATPYQPIYLPQRLLRALLGRFGVTAKQLNRHEADIQLGKICQRAGASYASGLELLGFRHFLPEGEDHWNESGHRRFRQWLGREHAIRFKSGLRRPTDPETIVPPPRLDLGTQGRR